MFVAQGLHRLCCKSQDKIQPEKPLGRSRNEKRPNGISDLDKRQRR
jgi:hypothetical protein